MKICIKQLKPKIFTAIYIQYEIPNGSSPSHFADRHTRERAKRNTRWLNWSVTFYRPRVQRSICMRTDELHRIHTPSDTLNDDFFLNDRNLRRLGNTGNDDAFKEILQKNN